MSRIPSLTYLVLRCADLERSRAFYAALGLAPVAERHGSGAEHYACDAGGVVLELYPLTAAETRGARIGLRVEHIEATVAAALRAGGSFVRADPTSVVLRDPDGHQVHLIGDEASRPATGPVDPVKAPRRP